MFWMVVGILILAHWFFRSPLCRAVSDQIRGRVVENDEVIRHVEALMEELRSDVRDVRAEVMDLVERVDFTERVLIEMRQRAALPSRHD